MKKLLMVVVAVTVLATTLFAALNANEKEKKDGVSTQSSLSVQFTQATEAEILDLSSSACDCVSAGSVYKENGLYWCKFTNSCSSSVSFTYQYWNGEKWVTGAGTLGVGASRAYTAGSNNNVRNIKC